MSKLRTLLARLLVCGSLLVIGFSVSMMWAQATSSATQYRKVPVKPGERCIICGKKLDGAKGDSAFIIHGRRVPLKAMMVDSFMNNQEKYFAKLEPKGALFQEEFEAGGSVALGGISSAWFLAGLYVFVALIFGGLSGCTAVAKGLRPMPHFFIGFVFSALGFLYVLTRPSKVRAGEVPGGLVKVPATYEPVPCPDCGTTNHPSAKRCSGCDAELQPLIQPEIERLT